MKNFKDLTQTEQQSLEQVYFIPTDKANLFLDEHSRPYSQTPVGKMYCSKKTNYNYSIKN